MAIGLQALFDDKNFQAGLARYSTGLRNAETATQRAANTMTTLGHTISTAIGMALADIALKIGASLVGALTAPINVLRSYGEAMDNFQEALGMSNAAAAQFVVGMKAVGLAPEEGAAALSYFVRQVAATRDQLAATGRTFADTAAEIRSNFVAAQQEAAARLTEIWTNFAEQRAQIEQDLADQIASIQESLSETLADIAYQRWQVDRDLTKSLARLEEDTRDRLRNARSARERRQIRKDAAQRKRDLIDEANERKAALDRQEAQAKRAADRQIAAAEKAAQKQIEAAERAAQKQVEAIEKALKKEEEARDKSLAKAQKTMGAALTQSPFAKALAQLGLTMNKVTDAAGNLTEHGLDLIMEAFKKLPQGVKASNIAMELFGRTGLKFLDWMRSDREAAKALAKELGILFDPQMTETFERQMSGLQLRFDALAISIGKAVLPSLTAFVEQLNKALLAAMPLVNSVLNAITEGFRKNGLQGGIDALKEWINDPKNKPKFQEMTDLFGKVWNDLVTALFGTVKFVASILEALLKAFADWVGTPSGQAWITYAMNTLADAAMLALILFFKTTERVGEAIVELSKNIIRWIQSESGRAWLTSVGQTLINELLRALSEISKNTDWWSWIFPSGATLWDWIKRHYNLGGTGNQSNLAPTFGTARQLAWAPAMAGATYNRTTYNISHTWNGNASAIDRTEIEGVVLRAVKPLFERG